MEKRLVVWSVLGALFICAALAFLAMSFLFRAGAALGTTSDMMAFSSPNRYLPQKEMGGDRVYYNEYREAPSPSSTGSAGSVLSAQSLDGRMAQEPETMIFHDYGTGIFLPTGLDRLSTFSLDVDTGSLTIARAYIARGLLPPREAIRAEEFINHYTYGYPEASTTIGVTADGAKSPFDENVHYLRIGVKAKTPDEREPAHVTFLIDRSGSMEQEGRIGLARRSVLTMVDALGPDDTIAIVAFNERADIILPTTPASQRQAIADALETITPGGSTNVGAGISLAYETTDVTDKEVKRVILISDGVTNTGVTDYSGILSIVQDKVDRIAISSVGVGMGNYNDVLMEQLADQGNGNYYYIDDLAESDRVFKERLVSTLHAVAYDARIQVEFDPTQVLRYRLIGYENRMLRDEEFRDDDRDAGEMGMGHEVTAIYELEIIGDEAVIGTARMRFQEEGVAKELVKPLHRSAISRPFDSASRPLKLAIGVARFSQILKLAAPPPEITQVEEILNDAAPHDDAGERLRVMVSDARILIQNR